IQTEDELIKHFETFGTPHEDNEHCIWKRFRMGRGQMFAYGKNTWRTATFRMTVDIQNDGLIYHLERDLPKIQGTTIDIELYDNPFTSTYSTIDDLADKLKHQVEFMPGVITFNGQQLNIPADDIPIKKWTEITNDAYFLFGVGSKLTFYNLGAYVMDRSAADVGVVGVVVSRKRFDVNFARGGIHDRCEIYQRVLEIVKKYKPVKKMKRRRKALEDWEKINILRDIRNGEVEFVDVNALALFPTTSGRSYSLNQIKNISSPWTFGDTGDRVADKLMQSEQAVVFDRAIVNVLSYSGEDKDFFTWLVARQDNYSVGQFFAKVSKWWREFNGLSSGFSNTYTILAHNKLTVTEKRILRVMEKYDHCWKKRRICIGVSDVAKAWTDGNAYIALERNWLRKLSLSSSRGATELLVTMVHELAHDENTEGTHVHGEAFYRTFHEICMEQWTNPLHLISYFRRAMEGAKSDLKMKDEAEKEKKAKDKRDKALGLTEDAPPVEDTGDIVTETKIAARVKVKPKKRSKGRMPRGARLE
ncbi:hypothetical protein LCGC14_1281320, partial [marine sediment metagenome]